MEAEKAEAELMKNEDARAQLAAAEEKLQELAEAMKIAKRDATKFRRWWLAEYHSLKVVVSLLPDSGDIEHFLSSSQARFASYSN